MTLKQGALRRAALVLLAALLCACERVPVLDGAQARVDAARERNDGPAVWRAVDEDSVLYLFGTAHLLPAHVQWDRPDMREAFADSGTVFFEADHSGADGLAAERLAAELGLRRDGRRLSDDLDDYQAKLLEAASHNGQIPLEGLDAMQPWLASEYLTASAARAGGLSPDLSPDEALKSRARASGKAIVYLETPSDQVRSVAQLPEPVQLAVLTDTLERFDTMPQVLERIAEHWAVGDVATLETLLVAPLADAPDGYVDAVLGARNGLWADRLDGFMQGSGTGFAAVGVSHLLGEDSLVSELKDRGYVVTRYFSFMGEDVITPTIAKIPETPGREE